MTDSLSTNERTTRRAPHVASAATIIAAGVVAYAGSFAGRFVLDDRHQILGKGQLGDLFSLTAWMGRESPLVDYSFALHHAIGNTTLWGYHAVNLGVHLLAALTLFGLVRRTLLLPGLCERLGSVSRWLALASALLWVVHPLQTQSVTYISQRSESMMGLFYLLTLYCVVRGVDADRESPLAGRAGRWFVSAVVACTLGMGSKAVMVTAPIMVLLYDRCFVAGSFADALRRRRGLYAGLAATWLFLFVGVVAERVLNSAQSGSLAGIGSKGIGPIDYAFTQLGVVVRYMQLSIWPRPLCLDYGWPVSQTFEAIALPLIVTGVLVGVTVRSLRRNGGLGFLGAWVILILFPTSGVVPFGEPLVEHRMYLPLAGVIVLIVIGAYAIARHLTDRSAPGRAMRAIPRTLIAAVAVVVLASLGYTTSQRNRDYADEPGMWEDVRTKRPSNERAVESHGLALIAGGKLADALPVMREAVALRPNSAAARNGFGLTLTAFGLRDEALAQFREAVRLNPDFVRALANLSAALVKDDRIEEAAPYFQRVLKIDPNHERARLDLGVSLLSKNQMAAALREFEAVTKANPNSAMAWGYLGTTLVNMRRFDDAVPALARAVALTGGTAQILTNLGFAHSQRKEWDDAIDVLRSALLMRPDYPSAHVQLGRTFFGMEDFKSAARHFGVVVELQPDQGASHYELGLALERLGNLPEARDEFEQALLLQSDLSRATTALERVRQTQSESGEQP